MASEAEKQQAVKERMAAQERTRQKMQDKQMVAPAPPPQSTVQQTDAANCRKTLEDAGWVVSGLDHKGDPMFADPLGTGDKRHTMVEARELPNRDGAEPTIVKQMVVPCTSWSYHLGEAFTIQQIRDRVNKSKVT